MTFLISFILIIFILFFFYINFKVTEKDFLSPLSIVCIMTMLSLIVMIANIQIVEFKLSLKLIFYVFSAYISFFIGGLIFPVKRKKREKNINNNNYFSLQYIIIGLIIVVFSTVLYYYQVRKVSILSGYKESSTYGILYYYRNATLNNYDALSSQSKIVGQLTIISYAIAYLILIDFVKRIINKSISNYRISFVIEVIIILSFIIQLILTGGRTQFLCYIESFVFLLFFYYFKKNDNKVSLKFFRKVIIIICSASVLFYLFGTFTGKTKQLNFSNTLFIYSGSIIPGFDKIINEKVFFENEYFGSNLFVGLLQLLNLIGFNFKISNYVAPITDVGNLLTNIYGSFGRYYATVGLFGMVIINIFLGFLYQFLYSNLQKKKNNIEIYLYVYLWFSRFLFDYCIEDRFFLSIISIGGILRICYGILFYKIFNTAVTYGKKKIL